MHEPSVRSLEKRHYGMLWVSSEEGSMKWMNPDLNHEHKEDQLIGIDAMTSYGWAEESRVLAVAST
jgi:hypothetical protein